MNTPITGVPFVAGLVVVTSAMIFVAFRVAHSRLVRAVAAMVAIILAVGTAAAAVNAYFSYLPTIATVLGQRAHDQASSAEVSALVSSSAIPAHGIVEKVSIPGIASHFDARPAQVYLPPAWFVLPHPHLPVLELLHGTPGTPEDWTRAAGADVVADAWAAAHSGRAPILLLVDENGSFTADTECANGIAGGRRRIWRLTFLPGRSPTSARTRRAWRGASAAIPRAATARSRSHSVIAIATACSWTSPGSITRPAEAVPSTSSRGPGRRSMPTRRD